MYILLLNVDLQIMRGYRKIGNKAAFYKRQLAVYNLTIYTIDSKKTINYIWQKDCKTGIC